jgi:hypothetical protein
MLGSPKAGRKRIPLSSHELSSSINGGGAQSQVQVLMHPNCFVYDKSCTRRTWSPGVVCSSLQKGNAPLSPRHFTFYTAPKGSGLLSEVLPEGPTLREAS